MKLGIVGLPNVGKSTLFNAITKAGAEAANYPFCTIEPNVGVVPVPDYRLEELAKIYGSKKLVPTNIEFYDIAGLVRGASKGEGLGNKFLAHIREAEAVIHVVRCFEDPNVTHVDGSVDPLRDIETISLELILSDMEILDRRIQKTRKMAKGDKALEKELELLHRLMAILEDSKSIRSVKFSEEEEEFIKTLALLSSKPIIYVCNVGEGDAGDQGESNPFVHKVKEFAEAEHSGALVISAQIEQEIVQLEAEERQLFLEDLGLQESGLDQLIKESYRLLGLISFLTAGPMESRAWTIKKGTKAQQAAGKIHSDIERGFIRAETIAFHDLIASGGNMAAAKEKGLVRLEGKDYIVHDGDVILFRFNV